MFVFATEQFVLLQSTFVPGRAKQLKPDGSVGTVVVLAFLSESRCGERPRSPSPPSRNLELRPKRLASFLSATFFHLR